MKIGELGRVYTDGEVLFEEGSKGDCMYVIQSGRVRIVKNTENGDATIAILKAGDIFGEMALFDKMPRSAAAVAEGEARVLRVDKRKLFTSISRDPTLVFKLLKLMSERIRRLNTWVTSSSGEGAFTTDSGDSIREVCETVLAETGNLIDADNGSILLADYEERTLNIAASFGSVPDVDKELDADTGIAAAVFESRKAEFVEDFSEHTRYASRDDSIKSMLCVPLLNEQQVIGVILLSNSSGKRLTTQDAALLNAIARVSSLAILSAASALR